MTCKKKNISQLFKNSDYHMADVSKKVPTFRRAVAMGRILVGDNAFQHIKNQTLPKGDVLKLAEIAGITGAKNTSHLIPLCHPLPLDHIAVNLVLEEITSSVIVYCLVSTYSKTGVEMEALAGVNAALLTMYDLTKPVEPALTITDTRLLVKEGGKKGLWIHPDGIPEEMSALLPKKSHMPLEGIKAAVVTLSDRAYNAEYEDKSGPLLKDLLSGMGAEITQYNVLPDETSELTNHLKELVNSNVGLVITTGGTGMSPRDITPETIKALCDRTIPGIGELLRSSGAQHLQEAWLSRSVAGVINGMLIVSLPGSPSAVSEGVEALKGILPHALELINNRVNRQDNDKSNKSHNCGSKSRRAS